ncbi:transposase [Suttonella ornithocola]|uniref:Transposase InsH N-terminal domain-containing protein n=1 Tax=Suttonella ornithocola TaxID=279832 RepID=A0A380MTG1_9GAMM|nr:transposase [Suttonella ornithocola]SUO95899.1 Uncharacterised protein [Suttonella ornithocola]
MINKHIDRYPLLKLTRVIGWQLIEHYLVEQKNQQQRANKRGQINYPLLSMFKAILLGQWYNLSDLELEYSLITRLDFYLSVVLMKHTHLTTAPFATTVTGLAKVVLCQSDLPYLTEN